MKAEATNRESQRANALAAEYRSKGYRVTIPRTEKDVPAFLEDAGYVPDIIATSEHENLIVEIRSQQTTGELARISEVAELVNAQPAWSFVLVLTNPRTAMAEATKANASKAESLLEKSIAIGTKDAAHSQAAFLFAWTAFEAAWRLISDERKTNKDRYPFVSSIRDAAMAGAVDRKDAQWLEGLFRIRNSLLHAEDEITPTGEEIERLRQFVMTIIRANGKPRKLG